VVSSTHKTDHCDKTEILLKVALNTIKQTKIYHLRKKMITGILILLFVKQYSQIQWIRSCLLLYPRSPKGEGGILFYLCLSVRPSFRPSKIFFVTFFSVTVDGRNLVFGHNHHIGIPYRGKRFGPVRFLLPVCWFCWFLYTFNIHLYMHIFRSIFLSNYCW
jgi:hypothetical protein